MRNLVLIVVVLGLALFGLGCGQAEEAGKNVDTKLEITTEAAEEVVEEAGEAVEGAVDEAGEALEEGAEAVANEAEEVVEGH